MASTTSGPLTALTTLGITALSATCTAAAISPYLGRRGPSAGAERRRLGAGPRLALVPGLHGDAIPRHATRKAKAKANKQHLLRPIPIATHCYTLTSLLEAHMLLIAMSLQSHMEVSVNSI